MNNFRKYLFVALFFGFLIFGIDTFLKSKPSHKNSRIYKQIQKYSPYYLDKRFGGLVILNRLDSDFKKKPDNMTVFKEFEQLEKKWGKKHLRIKNNLLVVIDNNGSKIFEMPLNSTDEVNFVHNYYGVNID